MSTFKAFIIAMMMIVIAQARRTKSRLLLAEDGKSTITPKPKADTKTQRKFYSSLAELSQTISKKWVEDVKNTIKLHSTLNVWRQLQVLEKDKIKLATSFEYDWKSSIEIMRKLVIHNSSVTSKELEAFEEVDEQLQKKIANYAKLNEVSGKE